MIKISTILISIFFVAFNIDVQAQDIFTDDFESGVPSGDWMTFWQGEDELQAVDMSNVPVPLSEGGNYVGYLQDVDASYTGAALAVAGSVDLQDYSIEAWVYCYVNHPDGSAYTGVVVYADTSVNTYIKLVADFDANQRMRLYNNHLDTVTFQYTFHHQFSANDIPGGIPTEDGWHKMKLAVKTINADTTAFWAYFDDQLLIGCPVYDTSDDRVGHGQFGLFSFQMDNDGIPGYYDNVVVSSLVTGIDDSKNPNSIPDEFVLRQNFPNPFNPETQISYSLTSDGYTSLTVHDLLGREVTTLVSEYQSSGSYTVTWNGKDNFGASVPSGVYIYTLKSGNFVASKKMILMK